MIHTGDVSYADGFAPRWDSFAELSEALFSSVPVVIASGNHDVVNNGAEYTAFEERYVRHLETAPRIPKISGPSTSVRRTSCTLILTLPSHTNVRWRAVADTFQTWLDNDLARVNRKQTPWIIAALHAPWYNSNSAHYKENEPQRLKYEQILYKSGVDVALNGHVHSYERSYPVYNNQRDECGITHIVVGDGGNYLRTIRLELDDSATVLVGISRRFFRRGFFNRAQRYAHELEMGKKRVRSSRWHHRFESYVLVDARW